MANKRNSRFSKPTPARKVPAFFTLKQRALKARRILIYSRTRLLSLINFLQPDFSAREKNLLVSKSPAMLFRVVSVFETFVSVSAKQPFF
ncbi:MAG: hypothetical protein LBR53_08465 [Deltaproteobacteria bacterium]|jgi:hypothetical protein|nr:hypothetical protein [Deltaproteobacteria bacterium]